MFLVSRGRKRLRLETKRRTRNIYIHGLPYVVSIRECRKTWCGFFVRRMRTSSKMVVERANEKRKTIRPDNGGTHRTTGNTTSFSRANNRAGWTNARRSPRIN